ncbi:MAG: helix-turn-helix domain-containing protein [Actinomycetota bacterium]|nr:helix-turn-helix domain-containing protein [Actinomycetota bacterium]
MESVAEFGSEVERRREAIRLVVDDGVGKAAAGRQVGRTRQWVSKWLRRYREDGDDDLVDRSRAPKTQPTKTPSGVAARILEVRERLDDNPVANIGALTILSRLEDARFAPIPSLRTIERVLAAAGVTRPREKRQRTGNKLPLPVVTAPGVWQQADWVQDRWLKGGIGFNSLQIADVGSHGVTAGQYLDRRLLTAVRFLVETAWPFLSIPQAMGTDNAFSSTTHQDNPFTIWVLACLFFGVEVIIGPPGGLGWTNHVEAVNNEWQRKTIWVEHFDSLDALRQGSNRAVEWLNTRRAVLDPDVCATRHPADYIEANRHLLRWPPTFTIDDHLDARGNLHLPLTAGRVTFLRHVDEHHTVNIAHTDWPVADSVPVGGLVTATITTADHRLEIRHRGEPVTRFDYPINHPIVDPYHQPAEHSLLHHV